MIVFQLKATLVVVVDVVGGNMAGLLASWQSLLHSFSGIGFFFAFEMVNHFDNLGLSGVGGSGVEGPVVPQISVSILYD